METRILMIVLIVTGIYDISHSQVGIGTAQPDSSAALEIKSTEGGLLLPRLSTSQIFYISGPEAGLVVFNSDSSDVWFFDGTRWTGIKDATDTLNPLAWQCGIDWLYAGKHYKTLMIGNQCWFAENLDAGTMIGGGQAPADNGQVEKHCYNNQASNCSVYGGLYSWDEMMQYTTDTSAQGICPSGWHLPSDEEWKQLEGIVDGTYGVGDPEWDDVEWRGSDAGGNLKEAGTAHWFSPNLGATNSSGFTALPGGWHSPGGSYLEMGSYGFFWTSTQYDGTFAYGRLLYAGWMQIARYPDYTKAYGLSVRCLRN